MNRNRQPMEANVRKKIEKEIKKAQKNLSDKPPLMTSATLVADKEVKQLPKKVQKKDKPLLEAFKKNIAIKKKKRTAPHSKRASPGSVEGQPAAPAYPNKEGARWAKTLTLQAKTQGKQLVKKLSKKR